MFPATCKNEACRNSEVNNGKMAVASPSGDCPVEHSQRVVRDDTKLEHERIQRPMADREFPKKDQPHSERSENS